jgi:poly-gamma-glutamate synthesis protein (capsule biosynthesis protein)
MVKQVITAALGVTLMVLIAAAAFVPNYATRALSPTVPILPIKDAPLSVLFVGDIMLDRDVAVHAREAGEGALFEGVKDLFAGYTLRIGNLEGTLTNNDSIAEKNHGILHFTFDPRLRDTLAQAGFQAVSLANNHALDFGSSGYTETVENLDAVHIGSFGSPYNDTRVALGIGIKDKRLCLLGYHSLFKSDYSMIVSKIISIRYACDHIIVFAHWGEEYHHNPIAQQVQAAHAFIDAGADVVIGGHPHVVEPLEIYNNHAIFYSLGNFVFDQGFQPEVMRGLTVGIEFDE